VVNVSAQALDPLSPIHGAILGWALAVARRPDDAIDVLKKVLGPPIHQAPPFQVFTRAPVPFQLRRTTSSNP
jgi:hypothetical protein